MQKKVNQYYENHCGMVETGIWKKKQPIILNIGDCLSEGSISTNCAVTMSHKELHVANNSPSHRAQTPDDQS